MQDLCDMFDNGADDFGQAPEEDNFMDAQDLSMALGFAALHADEDAHERALSEVDSNTELNTSGEERVSLKSRHKKGVDKPAFEQYVDKVCGL